MPVLPRMTLFRHQQVTRLTIPAETFHSPDKPYAVTTCDGAKYMRQMRLYRQVPRSTHTSSPAIPSLTPVRIPTSPTSLSNSRCGCRHPQYLVMRSRAGLLRNHNLTEGQSPHAWQHMFTDECTRLFLSARESYRRLHACIQV